MTNIFKGLDLIDRVPEEPWTEVHNTAQVSKCIPKKKKCKKAKWLCEVLQTAEKRREMKGKRETGKIYPSEFQRVPKSSKER